MKKTILYALIILLSSFTTLLSAQNSINKVEPPHWWTNMKNDTLHLIFYGENLSVSSVNTKRKDVAIASFRTSANGNYLFVDLVLQNTDPGTIRLEIINKEEKIFWNYALKKRDEDKPYPLGLKQSDFIYLLTPDRFSSGNDENDSFDTMNQTGVFRDSLKMRHGGDLQGIINHLNYIAELGVSAIWLNPIEENDEELESYHGYAITNHYAVDPRFGSNEDYKTLVDEAHKRGIKTIRDVVFNHFGDKHTLIKNKPDSSWVHYWDKFTKTTYRASVILDPHASESDKEIFSDGWFDHHMPDMDYTNKALADYMIQNSIWWVEEYNIDAYRIDTYIYPNQDFMKRWAKELKEEYPNLFLFAETWVHASSIQAWFAGGDRLNQGETYLDGVTDFQLYFAINNALNQSYSWNTGLAQVYYKLVDDVLYAKPENNVLFLDNHDLDRFYGVMDEDFAKFKLGVGLLFTLRGIPSLFYGTEILMPYKGDHGKIRSDFPGGWPTDTINKFTSKGRTELENEALNYIKYLANWRKQSTAITEGKLIQYIPSDGLYVFARFSEDELVLVLSNQSNKEMDINLKDYNEVVKNMKKYRLVLDQMAYSESEVVKILPMSMQILSFKYSENNILRNSPASAE